MSLLIGFAPWIVYWVLVGNVPFLAAVLVALAVAVASSAVGRTKKAPGVTFEIGSVATLLLLTILTLTLSQSFMERWSTALSFAGIFIVVLVGVLVGKPFMREFVGANEPDEVVSSRAFKQFTTIVTWVWVTAYGAMTVSSVIPPMLHRGATILDTKTPVSFVFYWLIPISLMGVAAVVTRRLSIRMSPRPVTAAEVE